MSSSDSNFTTTHSPRSQVEVETTRANRHIQCTLIKIHLCVARCAASQSPVDRPPTLRSSTSGPPALAHPWAGTLPGRSRNQWNETGLTSVRTKLT